MHATMVTEHRYKGYYILPWAVYCDSRFDMTQEFINKVEAHRWFPGVRDVLEGEQNDGSGSTC